jgi:hypothetical protein
MQQMSGGLFVTYRAFTLQARFGVAGKVRIASMNLMRKCAGR